MLLLLNSSFVAFNTTSLSIDLRKNFSILFIVHRAFSEGDGFESPTKTVFVCRRMGVLVVMFRFIGMAVV